jgi:GNAT superfamily N-acetyltransferase
MIRRFRPSDENACRNIIAKCFDKSVILSKKGKAYIKKLFITKGYLTKKNREYDILVYVKDKKILGMGSLNKDYIGKVYVNPSMHGKGIGKEIMLFLEKLAVKRGYSHTLLRAYRNSKGFYSKQGYHFVKMHVYTGEKNIRIPTYEMRKELK